ncbi:MAG: hypothetical protein IKO26_07880 [Paludibacteraceae bacterium]|nr:hypothetical protein [Paludibacteraceae bacterium]
MESKGKDYIGCIASLGVIMLIIAIPALFVTLFVNKEVRTWLWVIIVLITIVVISLIVIMNKNTHNHEYKTIKLMKNKIFRYLPIILYIVMVGISALFIRFDLDITRYSGRIYQEACTYNIRVAKYYFLTLPLSTIIITAAFYWLRSKFVKQNNLQPEKITEKVIGRRHAVVRTLLDMAEKNISQGTNFIRQAEKRLLEEIDIL